MSDTSADATPYPAPGHLVVHLNADNWGSTSEFVVPLDGHEVTIGRSPGCTISLDNDALVSRHHAIIRHSYGGYVITDLGSSNGTLVNSVPIAQETMLREGDLIHIGECEIIFSMAPAPAEHLEASPNSPTTAILPAITLAGNQETESTVSDSITMPTFALLGNAHDALPDGPESAAAHEATSAAAAFASESIQAPAAPPAPDLDAIQTQLTDMVGQLKHQAEAAAHEVERLKAEIATITATLAMLVETDRQLSTAGPDLVTLLQVTERTIESPRHLDNVIEFATHAPEIGAALVALQDIRSSSGLIAALDALRERLASLI
jgi:pSer/pThr/pTyr-binding forkhead associated (FHA) protein